MAQSEPHLLPASFTREKQEEMYGEIVRLYDLADEALAVVQKDDVANRELLLTLLVPFITQVTNSANILTSFYNEVVNKGYPVTPELQDVMESAFRNIFFSLREFIEGAEQSLLNGEGQYAG